VPVFQENPHCFEMAVCHFDYYIIKVYCLMQNHMRNKIKLGKNYETKVWQPSSGTEKDKRFSLLNTSEEGKLPCTLQ